MSARRTLIAATLALTAASASLSTAFASPAAKAKPLKGTWSYLDTTPDPSVVANSNASEHCHGKLPSSPVDVNSHTLKVTGPGTLTVVGHNKLDWAMEVRDSKGNVLAGSDGSSPTSAEGAVVTLTKAGAYAVVYCSAEGEPSITADYTFKPR